MNFLGRWTRKEWRFAIGGALWLAFSTYLDFSTGRFPRHPTPELDATVPIQYHNVTVYAPPLEAIFVQSGSIVALMVLIGVFAVGEAADREREKKARRDQRPT